MHRGVCHFWEDHGAGEGCHDFSFTVANLLIKVDNWVYRFLVRVRILLDLQIKPTRN